MKNLKIDIRIGRHVLADAEVTNDEGEILRYIISRKIQRRFGGWDGSVVLKDGNQVEVNVSDDDEKVVKKVQTIVNKTIGQLNVIREVVQGLEDYEKKTAVRFAEDMLIAGYKVMEYGGRFGYRGPAVHTDVEHGIGLQEVIRATSVQLNWEDLGERDLVVYPVL
jgi:hypothetical protein